MPSDTPFRISSYLTLTLACACLGYAELAFLPATPFLMVAWWAFLLLAYLLEGRWSLSTWSANVLGIAIFGLTVYWVGNLYSLALSGQDWNGIPWPAVLLPHAGPLLMLLLLAKLFRPKRLADHWFLQTIGFLHVALACVLVAEPLFGVLLFAYLSSGLWCLILLQTRQEDPDAPAAIQKEKKAGLPAFSSVPVSLSSRIRGSTAETPPALPFFGLRHAGRWALVVAVLGVILFLAIPRGSSLLWDPATLSAPGRQNLETGYTSEIDMSTSGAVEVSDEVAFEVTVVDSNGRPKVDLSAEQRWRGTTLSFYNSGRWYAGITVKLYGETGVAPPRQQNFLPKPQVERRHTKTNSKLPDLGAGEYFLTFSVDRRRAGGFFLADPVVLGPGETQHPYTSLAKEGFAYQRNLFYEMDGTLCGLPRPYRGQFSYVQVTRPAPPGQEGLTRPRWLLYPDAFYTQLHIYPLPALRAWSSALLQKLAASRRYGLKPDHLRPGGEDAPLRAENHEAVAHALERYFASSEEYSYSLDLRRSGRQRDPTLDFLLVVKRGHCERFAGALALVLRSLAIPTRIVNGFRGAEHLGDGRYVVRQSQAHSWVEALLPAREMHGQRCWVTLDPTPPSETQRSTGFDWSRFWAEGLRQTQILWRSFIVDFNPDQQRDALAGLWELLAPGQGGRSLGDWVADSYGGRFWRKPGFWVLTAFFGLVTMLVVRRFRRRRGPGRKRERPGGGFYGKLLMILERRCRLRPTIAQTPRELAEAARQLLRRTPAVAGRSDLSELPVQIAALFYRMRFGQRDPSQLELRETERRLTELDRALRGKRASTLP